MKCGVKRFLIALVGSTLIIGIHNAQAALVVDVAETAGDVVFAASGTVDFTGLSSFGLTVTQGAITPVSGALLVGPSIDAITDGYEGVTAPGAFGTGNFILASTGTGETFGFISTLLLVPQGYASSAPIAATSKYAGATFASLGLTPGTYIWTWSSDSVTLRIGSAVPLPPAIVLLGSALIGVGFTRRKPQ